MLLALHSITLSPSSDSGYRGGWAGAGRFAARPGSAFHRQQRLGLALPALLALPAFAPAFAFAPAPAPQENNSKGRGK